MAEIDQRKALDNVSASFRRIITGVRKPALPAAETPPEASPQEQKSGGSSPAAPPAPPSP